MAFELIRNAKKSAYYIMRLSEKIEEQPWTQRLKLLKE